jgi:choline dehydrogenase-like flavoprotein
MIQQPDVLVIGSGIGGGTLASRLVQHGLHVTILERGGFLPQEAENWNVNAVFRELRYVPTESWVDKDGNTFRPGTYYYVGGSSKMFGAVMLRLREADFKEMVHEDGISPEWPIKYPHLEPYYTLAEKMYCVHGEAGLDPTEPAGVPPYPFPALPFEPVIQEVHTALRAAGIASCPLPVAVQRDSTGNCIRCMTCDGFPCKVHAKTDAEVAAVRPALATGKLTLITDAKVTRLNLSEDGSKIQSVVYETNGSSQTMSAPVIVLAASAVNSAVLLLNSACPQAPNGVANRSGVVGRNYMAHNNTALMCVGMKRNPTKFQKSININDFYFGDSEFKYPMGNVQGLGKLQEQMLTLKVKLLPAFVARLMAERSVDWWVMSEDLPNPENRVIVRDGKIHLIYENNNMKAHRRLVKQTIKLMRRLGFALNLPYYMTGLSVSHQCGTVRFGTDPKTAALDSYCRAFDHKNLFVVDASFFPSSSAVNPALTIAAQALRVADHIATVDFAGKSHIAFGKALELVPPLTMRTQEFITLPT